jgi:hypothetical protein
MRFKSRRSTTANPPICDVPGRDPQLQLYVDSCHLLRANCGTSPTTWRTGEGRRLRCHLQPLSSAARRLRDAGGGESPPFAEFTQRRMPTPWLFRGARDGPRQTSDETEFQNLPGPAAGRHHCRWSHSRPASTTLKSRYACGAKAAAVCNHLGGRAPVRPAKPAPAESHQLQRQRYCRAGATRGQRPLSFPPWSVSDRS